MKEKRLKEPMPEEPNPEARPKGFAPAVELADTDALRRPFLELIRLRQIKDDQEEAVKQTNKALLDKQFECVTILEQHGLQNARLEGVGLVYVSLKDHVSVTADQKQALFDELRQRGFEDVIKVEPSVHNGTLASLCKEIREQGEPPLQTVSIFTEKKIVVRK